MNLLTLGVRIKLQGSIVGMVVVAIFGLAIAGIITGILSTIQERILGIDSAASKVLDKVETVLWIATLILVILDLAGILPFYRIILFAILDRI